MKSPLLLALLLLAACGGGGTPSDGSVGGGTGGSGGGGSGGGGGSTAASAPGTRSDRVLLKVHSLADLTQVLSDHGTSLLSYVPGTSYVLVGVTGGRTAIGMVTQLEGDARVAAAALDLGLQDPEGTGSTIPAGGQIVFSEVPNQPELLRIGAAAARGRATGLGVRVALVDSGVLPDPAGVASHVDGDGYDLLDDDADPTDVRNGADDDGDGRVDEAWGHGNFVASLILAVAPDVRLVPFRVLDADGIGTSSGVAAAITYAAQRGVTLVNLSVDVPPEVDVVREAIENARVLGVAVVAAAGNTGAQDVDSPSAMDSAFVVAAVDAHDQRPGFASYGTAVDLSAPGDSLSGAYPKPPGTAIWSGSSFATALVTGGFALVRQLHPFWTYDDVAQRVRLTSAPLPQQQNGGDGRLGVGRLNLDAATGP